MTKMGGTDSESDVTELLPDHAPTVTTTTDSNTDRLETNSESNIIPTTNSRHRSRPKVNYTEPKVSDSELEEEDEEEEIKIPHRRGMKSTRYYSDEDEQEEEFYSDNTDQEEEEEEMTDRTTTNRGKKRGRPKKNQKNDKNGTEPLGRGRKKKKLKKTTLKKRNLPKPVPYQPIQIPFGQDEIESLLNHRKVLKEEKKEGEEGEEERDEFLVKFKYQSHHHCRWLSQEEVELKTNHGKSRIKKLLHQIESDPTKFEEVINPVHLTIDRILDEGEILLKHQQYQIYLLIKWNGLPYDQSTWEKLEFIQDLDPIKPTEFYHRQTIPKSISTRRVARPDANQFIKLETSPPFKGDHQLRDYQLEGLNWLNYCYHHHRSCIMADEMGLGKTVQSVSFLNQVYHTSQVRGPFIIVAPLSTIPHWEREFSGWTQLNTIVYHGSVTSRNLIVDTEFYYKDTRGSPLTDRYKFDVLITSYEMLSCGQSQLKPIPWRVAIFDEAHRLKNSKSKLLDLLTGFSFEHRVLLTGTPLQNSVLELFNLLKFLDPIRFHSEVEFLAKYGDLKSCTEVTELQELLKPLMLRRFKEDVEKSIPDKEETVIEVELTRTQKLWYRAILERNFTWIQRGGGKGAEGPSLNNIMMELRKCCNHPFLIKGAEDKIVLEEKCTDSETYTRILIEASGKLVLLDKLLPRLKEGGHKVLIFSQMTRVLDLLTEYLARRRYPYERIDGNVKGQDRQMAIDRYSSSDTSFIFLLCTRAGGVGINLTAADTVVIFDSDWNPQNDIQAQARAHRIGQTRPVKIYRLLCANTYERQMFDRANLKLGLDKAVMQKMTGALTDPEAGLSKKEVEELLKLGAYGALLDDDESNKFCTEDIDHILERRTLVVQREGNQKGTAFSKASFSHFENDPTDLNDPEFWSKWAAKANLAPEDLKLTNPLIIDHPRTRRRVNRFDVSTPQKVIPKPGEPEPELEEGGSDDDSDYSSYSDDDDEEEEHEVNSDSPSSPIRTWRMSERNKLERALMIYGLNSWESFLPFLPKRTIPDIRACALHHLLFLLRHPNLPQWIASSDLTGMESDLKAAIRLEGTNYDPTVDWEKLLLEEKVPYPDATELQITEFRTYLHQAPRPTIDQIAKKPKALFYRLQILYRICQIIVPTDPTKLSNFHAPKINSLIFPAPWWNEHSDRDILIGIQWHGYLQFTKIRSDPELSFSKFKFVDDPSKVKEPWLLWPSWAEIGARIRRLISGYFNPPQSSKLGKIHQWNLGKYSTISSPSQPGDSPRPGGSDRSNMWFPKPLKSFLLILSTFGVENTDHFTTRTWDQFRTLTDLPKRTDRELDSLLYLVIKLYTQVLQSDTAREVRLRNVGVLEFGKELLTLLPPCTDPLPASLVTPTPEKAKRLIKRIMQLENFRKLVATTDVTPYLTSIPRLPGFPPWWDPPLHNPPFVTALLRYGVGSFHHLIRDPTLPFQHAQLETWPKEAQVISWVERLIYLHTVATRPQSSHGGKGGNLNHRITTTTTTANKGTSYSVVIYDPVRGQFTSQEGKPTRATRQRYHASPPDPPPSSTRAPAPHHRTRSTRSLAVTSPLPPPPSSTSTRPRRTNPTFIHLTGPPPPPSTHSRRSRRQPPPPATITTRRGRATTPLPPPPPSSNGNGTGGEVKLRLILRTGPPPTTAATSSSPSPPPPRVERSPSPHPPSSPLTDPDPNSPSVHHDHHHHHPSVDRDNSPSPLSPLTSPPLSTSSSPLSPPSSPLTPLGSP